MLRLPIILLLLVPGCAAAAPAQQHPRLFLTAGRIAQLRDEIATLRKPHWDILRAQADLLAHKAPPDYEKTIRSHHGDQLWQRDVGNALPALAMAWVLSRDEKYRKAASAWALASCGYPTWGTPKSNGTDLEAGHQLLGLALVYDWMYSDLDPKALASIHKTLLDRGRTMFNATDPKTGMFWRDNYMQNHLWVNAMGLVAAGLAISEEPETARWIEVAREKFRLTDAALGSDGASHEGACYWSYGVEYMLKFWALSTDLWSEDLRSPWWSETALYRIYIGLPQLALAKGNMVVDIGDCTRQEGYGPDYQLFNLAHRFQDPHAQWLALELEKAHLTALTSAYLNLLWFDPQQSAKPLNDLPTMHHFEDIGIVSARSDWSGKESMVVFKSGPPMGHDEVAKGFTFDAGMAHVHPDANHFVIFGNGGWIIPDDGYRWKETGQHNTLLVDGIGQKGEHAMWFRGKTPLPAKGEPTILAAESNPSYDFMAGEAEGAYRPEAGLRRYVRRLIYWKPSTLLVIDDIETDHPRNLELRLHPLETSGVRIDDLTPEGVSIDKGIVEGKDRDGKPFPQYTVSMRTTAAKWHHAMAISWPNEGKDATPVKMQSAGDNLIFESAAHKLGFSWRTGKVSQE